MKIISKYKDFYDFIVQDYDSDLNYVRSIGLVNEYYDDLYRKENNYIPYFNKYYGYQDTYQKNRKNGELSFGGFIFGIYPFVFCQPALIIYYKHKSSGTVFNKYIVLGRELVNKILDESTIVSKAAFEEELISLAQKNFNKLANDNNCEYDKVFFDKYNTLESLKKSLKYYTWKTSCPEIFYKLESPVWVKYREDLFQDGTYWNNWPEEPKIGKSKYTHYVTDISFQQLNMNILKYWYSDLFDLNTYINIENFLWSIKQEPEAKPDNKTKIVAHGFDLKTSFRKM